MILSIIFMASVIIFEKVCNLFQNLNFPYHLQLQIIKFHLLNYLITNYYKNILNYIITYKVLRSLHNNTTIQQLNNFSTV
jgi:hypothetical protein